MREELSNKEKSVLIFIEEEIKKRRIPPAVREICDEVGFKSTSTVHAKLKSLEQKGYIRKDPSKPRSIEVLIPSGEVIDFPKRETNNVPSNDNVANIPVLGKVTAGAPILAYEEYEDYFPVPLDFVGPGEHFMLRVSGESMINVGILDRDFVMVKRQNHAKNGDMVVALIDDSATVKTYYKEKNRFRLQPENDTMEAIYVNEVEILGIVKALFRKFD